MSGNYEAKLADMGITLPAAPAPAAKYVPFVVIGDMVYVSGQISQDAGGLIKGKLGDDMETEAGAAAARTCALGLMAQLKAACDGDLDRLVRVVKLTGFVNSTPDFTEQPQGHQWRVQSVGGCVWRCRGACAFRRFRRGIAIGCYC
jgi:enamine deaminase RidA (YjgF/YER057c/UK114 family)